MLAGAAAGLKETVRPVLSTRRNIERAMESKSLDFMNILLKKKTVPQFTFS